MGALTGALAALAAQNANSGRNIVRAPAPAPAPVVGYFAPAPAYVPPSVNYAPSGNAYRPAPAPSYAQQVINRAIAYRNTQQQPIQQAVARNAVRDALAIATGQAAPRQVPQFRQANPAVAADHFLSGGYNDPSYVNRAEQAAINQSLANRPEPWDIGQPGGGAPIPPRPTAPMTVLQRTQAEQAAVAAFPEIGRTSRGESATQYIRSLDNDQLLALLELSPTRPKPETAPRPDPLWTGPLASNELPPRYDPLSGNKAGTPPPFYDPLSGPKTGLPISSSAAILSGPKTGQAPVFYDPLSGPKTGAAQVTSAFEDALRQRALAAIPTFRGTSFEHTSEGRLPSGGGVLNTIGDFADNVLSPLGPLGALLEGGKDLWQVVGESVSNGYESFTRTAIGQKVAEGLELLDRGRQENAQNYGQMFTQWANGETIEWLPGGMANPLNQSAALPVILIGEVWEEFDPTIKDDIKAVSQGGYSSPEYLEMIEAAGYSEAEVGPQFTGDRAVWEFLVGRGDDLPPAVKYPLRMAIDTTIDPLTWATAGVTLGESAAAIGRGIRTADDAGVVSKVAGGALEGVGRTGAAIARAPDALVEVPIKIGKTITRQFPGLGGEVTGLFSPSTASVRAEAGAAAHSLDEALVAGRASVPDEPARQAFDAETQGVAPASGPRLIETPSAGTAAPPASGAAPPPRRVDPSTGEIIDTPRAAAPSPDDPRFTSYGDGIDLRAGQAEAIRVGETLWNDWHLARGIDPPPYNPIRRGGAPARTAHEEALAQANRGKFPDGKIIFKNADGTYSPSMSNETRGRAPITPKEPVGVTASRTSSYPTVGELNKQIKEKTAILATGTPDEISQAAAELQHLLRMRDDLRAGRATVSSEEVTGHPPVTKVERDAAAAAGSTTDTPRSRGAAETVRAGENAKAKPGKKSPMKAADRKAYPSLAKAVDRNRRMAKEDARNLPKEVNKILREQKPGEHEFSPVYEGHRPLDQIVTKAIKSGDPEQMKKADALVKQVDASVEKHLRPDPFYRTWKKGGQPVYLQRDPRLSDDFFELMTALEPGADPVRQKVLANGLAKGVLDDIAEQQFNLNHLIPMIQKAYPPTGAPDAVTGFKTAKGSTYEVTSSGTTIRNKSPHPEHPGDVGLKPESQRTIYFDDPGEIGYYQLITRQDPNWVNTPKGQAWAAAHISDTPKIGWHPFETWADGKRHVGNAITEISGGGSSYSFKLDGLLGSVGRIESKNFRDETAEWLIREYLDTPNPAQADLILHTFLANPKELTILADGVHVPYAHSIPVTHHAESIARLQSMREQWRQIKRGQAVSEVPDTPFRDADLAAQFAGGSKASSKSVATSIKKSATPSDEAVIAAIGEINDPELSNILLKGDGKFTVSDARALDQAMPAGWKPAGYKGDKVDWNVKDALDWGREQSLISAQFDHAKYIDEVGQLAAGLQPKRTAKELASMRKAAKANGIDPKTVVDGTSSMERIAATKAVRGWDWKLRHYRSLRLFNPIIGLPNRIGDVLGNAMALAGPGGNITGGLKSIPLTFTETRAYRGKMRDTRAVLDEWATESPHMAELGLTYSDSLVKYSKLQDAGINDALPPTQGWLKKHNAPRGVMALSSAWTSPALKDMMVASEMVGRKQAFDNVLKATVQKEAFPEFLQELERRFPGQAKAVLKSIQDEASAKGGKKWNGFFSYGDVKAAVDEDLARFWQRKLNAAAAKGEAEADRLFFKGSTTNADEIARRTLTFHYWMVRSSVLYGRWILRNPMLLSGFYRMYEEAHQIAEQHELPGWLGGMMKFYTIPGNATGYAAMDPLGALFPTFFMDAYSQEGNKFQALQNLLVPEWSAALGALGLTQNTPDLTGTRNLERFVIDMGNFLKGEGVPLESIPGFGKFIDEDSLTFKVPTEEFAKFLISSANNLTGEIFGDFTPFDRQANEEDQLYSIGLTVGQGLYGDDPNAWTPEQMQEVLAAIDQAKNGEGEETWLSETIRSTYGREGGARAGFSLLIPGGVVTRQGARDEDIELSNQYWKDFFAGKATTKEGENAATKRSLATAANPAWIVMNNDYYKIGTKEEQQQYTLFNSMRYSPEELNPNSSIVIDMGNGTYTFYTMAQLADLSEEDRKTVLAAWMEANPSIKQAYEKVKNGRDQFEVDHPDYGQYTEYRSAVNQYDGGIAQFRRDMADNPTFMAAMEEERKRLKAEGKTGAVLEAELDHWATSQPAFFAATGRKYKRDDTIEGTPGPSSVAAMFSLRPDKASSGGSSGEKKEPPKDPNVDDYWSPEKGVPRLTNDQTQFDHDNAEMERRFGSAWNQAAAEWEDDYDSAKERDEAGIGDKPYVLPSVTETMRRYEVWEEEHPGGTPEQFFGEMLQTEGFGKKVGGAAAPTKTLPGGTVRTTSGQAPTLVRRAAAALGGFPGGAGGVRSEPAPQPRGSAAVPQPAPKAGRVALTGGTKFPLSQEYGMTDFAQTQVGPGGMYDYTDQYTRDGSYVGHMGLDIGTPLGTALYAPVSGTVVQAGGVPFEYDDRYRDNEGNALPGTGGLRIEMPNGDIVVMAHMQEITVNVGDTVTTGQPVGYSGTAGGGPHVHVEYRQYAPGSTGSGYLAVDPRTKLDLGV